MTRLAELVEIPERVHRGDFVLRLAEGVAHPDQTLHDYVVTEQLARCFDQALGLIRSGLDARSSKGAYLHGSFGSGKSHFMAVLHLLLQHDAAARSIPELAGVVARHGAWLEGKRLLLVPYHMIGAPSMEAAILGHYVEHVRGLHPEAPPPGVYVTEGIFEDSRRARARMSDEAFFALLNEGRPAGGGGWGALGAPWDAARFEQAMSAPARSEERSRLVADLVTRMFTAYRNVAALGEGFVSLDDGLALLSKHAKGLGYDGLVLFLDELILWLASHVGDMAFVSREGQKLAKLVESTTPDRPIPIVSFIARQRDLRELVGEHVPGAERLGFADVLKWWEQRFDVITLEDRNLPAIAERRLLRPRSDEARKQIDRAFEETTRVREEVMNVLLTSDADRQMFRAVYPFSPALVQTLVAVSSALQRERTALRVMLQLLVDQRETLEVGDLVPVGDLFDVIAEGDEPFTEDMRVNFENAKRLYYQKLLPLLEQEHRLRLEEARTLPPSDPRGRAFRADDRIVKTLLLAALAPEVESLKALTGGRLAALNHGTIRSPIPGQEGRQVLAKCRGWAAQVGEVKIGEEPANPTIAVQITGVDTEGILDRVRNIDNVGNRRRKVREILFEQLGVADEDKLFVNHEVLWCGTRRRVEIVYGNVRELPDESLRARGPEWKVVIDFPFDEEGRTPRDDLARLDQFRADGESARTLCWVPSFLGRSSLKDLGTLVILDHILTRDRFSEHAGHLAPVDRATARTLLENQRSQLRGRMRLVLEGAYGVTVPPPGAVEAAHDLAEHFQSLAVGFQPRPPVGADFKEAFAKLLDQMLVYQYPAHPEFAAEVRPAALRRVLQEVQRAAQAPNGRIVVERELRPLLRQVANPLRLGEMHEEAFLLGDHWRRHFLKKAAEVGGPITVAKLRAWTDEPAPAGLTKDVQNLVILAFAEQTSRSFFLHGGPIQGALDNLPDELELREQALPAAADWVDAARRAAAILGVAASPMATASSVSQLAGEAKRVADVHREACGAIRESLEARAREFGIGADVSRLRTARAAERFVEAVHAATLDNVVAAIVRASVETTEEAMGTSIKKAAGLAAALDQVNFELFGAIDRLPEDPDGRAARILGRVREAIEKDELALALEPVLRAAQAEALLLLAPPVPSAPRPGPAPGPAVVSPSGAPPVEAAERQGLDPDAAQTLFRELERKLSARPGRRLSVQWKIEESEEAP